MSLFIRSCLALALVLTTASHAGAQCNPSCGTSLTKWGPGPLGGQFAYPQGVAVDGSGNVFVADSGNNRIEKFTSTGTFLLTWGSLGSGDGQFNYPIGV